jgi:hypothetical protein
MWEVFRWSLHRVRFPWGRPTIVLRGGSWNNNQQNARAAYRNHNRPDNFNNNNGFRLAWPMIQRFRPVKPHESCSRDIDGRGHLC